MRSSSAQGFALLIAVFSLLALGILGAVLVGGFGRDLKGAVGQLDSIRALAAADAGVRWVFQNNVAGDLDLSNNVSPTDAPYGANAITLGVGKFWVEYSSQAANSMDLRVTAVVNKAERVLSTRVTILPARPMQRTLFNEGWLTFSAITSYTMNGTMETQSTPLGFPSDFSALSAFYFASKYDRFNGADLDWLEDNADVVLVGNQTWNAAGGPYGDPVNANRIIFIRNGDLTLDGENVPAVPIVIRGAVVLDNGSIQTVNQANVDWQTWPASHPSRSFPAMAADSVSFGGAVLPDQTSITIGGAILTQGGGAGVIVQNAESFDLAGGIWSEGDVMFYGIENLALQYGPQYAPKDPPWIKINGPDVEYLLSSWKEVPSS